MAEPPEPLKRSGHVALLLMGTLAVGGTAYALMPRTGCEPSLPGLATPATPGSGTCTSTRSSGGSGGSGFRRAGNGSSGSASDTSSTTTTTRGGFGSLARAFGFSSGS